MLAATTPPQPAARSWFRPLAVALLAFPLLALSVLVIWILDASVVDPLSDSREVTFDLTVVDSASGRPIAGAVARVIRSTGDYDWPEKAAGSVTTDRQGRTQLVHSFPATTLPGPNGTLRGRVHFGASEILGEGSWSLKIEAPGYSTDTWWFNQRPDWIDYNDRKPIALRIGLLPRPADP